MITLTTFTLYLDLTSRELFLAAVQPP